MCVQSPALNMHLPTELSLCLHVCPELLLVGQTAGAAGLPPQLSTRQAGTRFQAPPLLAPSCADLRLSLGFLICKTEIVMPTSWAWQVDPNTWCSAWQGVGTHDMGAVLLSSIPCSRDHSKTEISGLCVEAKKCLLSEEFCFGR